MKRLVAIVLGLAILAFLYVAARTPLPSAGRDEALAAEVRGLRESINDQATRLLHQRVELETLRTDNRALARDLAVAQKRLAWWEGLKVAMADRASMADRAKVVP